MPTTTNAVIPRINQTVLHKWSLIMIGTRILQHVMQAVVPRSTTEIAIPLLLGLAHLITTATTGAQHAEWPIPMVVKKVDV